MNPLNVRTLPVRLGATMCLGLMLAAGLATTSVAQQNGSGGSDANSMLPDTLVLPAVVRDFKANDQSGGHVDFQRYISNLRFGLVAQNLGPDGKPQFASSTGRSVSQQARNSAGRPISPYYVDTSKGDQPATTSAGSGAAIMSAQSFHSWYNDTPGTNVSKIQPLTFHRIPGTNRYVFDSDLHEPWKSRGGFFPINGELYGNYANNSKGVMSNFHFTTELETTFTYERNANMVFTFTGDDDVWVFIDGRLVIDLGGVHAKVEQSINLDRLNWLQDGQRYSLKVFHAERHTTQSNFRIETNIRLEPAALPATTALSD
jgi:fibro-slime domain-containing protein